MTFDLYREVILEHSQHPQNYGKLRKSTHSATELNPLCGDEVTLYLNVTRGIIKDVHFDGNGCAISQASASVFTEMIKRKSVKEAQKIGREEILAELGIDPPHARLRCALLAVEVFRKAFTLKQEKQLASIGG